MGGHVMSRFVPAACLLLFVLFVLVAPAAGQPVDKGSPTKGSSTKESPPPPKTPAPPSKIDGKTLAEWIEQLRTGDPSRRTQAILAICQFGDASAEAVPALLERLGDADTSPRIKAVVALRFVAVHDADVPKVVKALANRLWRPDPKGLGRTTHEGLLEGQIGVRHEVALSLQRFWKDTEPVISELANGSKDPGSWEVRYSCLQLLWRIPHSTKESGPDDRVVRAVLARLHDSTHLVRLEAVMGLCAMGRPVSPMLRDEVVKALQAIFLKERRSTRDFIYVLWAYVGLVGLEDKLADDSLKVITNTFLRSPTLEVRVEATRALAFLGKHAKSRVPSLIAVLEKKGEETPVIQGACFALGQIGDKSDKVIDALLKLAEHKDVGCVGAALSTLTQLAEKDPKVVAALLAAAKKDKPGVIVGALSLLAKHAPDDPKVVDALLNATQNKDPGCAVSALGLLTQYANGDTRVIADLEKQLVRTDKEFEPLRVFFQKAVEDLKTPKPKKEKEKDKK